MIKYVLGNENRTTTVRDKNYTFEDATKYIKNLIKDEMLTRDGKRMCIYQRVLFYDLTENENLTILWEE